jgi:hypothetical protein
VFTTPIGDDFIVGNGQTSSSLLIESAKYDCSEETGRNAPEAASGEGGAVSGRQKADGRNHPSIDTELTHGAGEVTSVGV